MELSLNYWYMLPVAFVIASLATTIGIGGATMFSPFFMLLLKLRPEVAIGVALILEVFGFTSGVSGYAYKRIIDYKLAGQVLLGTVPAAVLGVVLSHLINGDYLKLIFGFGLIVLALKFLQKPDDQESSRLDHDIERDYGQSGDRLIAPRRGENIRYHVCNIHRGRSITAIGGFFVGLISTGLGELNDFFFLRTCRVPSKVATGTSVLIVAVTALVASLGHFRYFLSMGQPVLNSVLNITIFAVPGVILGGQLGSILASRMKARSLEALIAVLFILIGFVTLAEVVLR